MLFLRKESYYVISIKWVFRTQKIKYIKWDWNLVRKKAKYCIGVLEPGPKKISERYCTLLRKSKNVSKRFFIKDSLFLECNNDIKFLNIFFNF